MYEHLRVIALPYEDRDTLGRLEDEVLREIHPPLNLMGMNSSELRVRLTELRRAYGKRTGLDPGTNSRTLWSLFE